MNQRFLALALIGALTLTLTACAGGGADPSKAPVTPPPAVSYTPSPTPSAQPEPTATPALSPSPAPTAEPTQSPQPTAKPTIQPTAKPTAKPTQAPTPTAAPSEAPAPERSKVQQVWDEIAKQDLSNLTDLDADTLSALYGISASDLEEYICKMPLMNVKATEFFIAKVKDGKMDAVQAGAQKRQADLDAQWSTYLPDQYELVQDYRLVTNGNYLLFVVSEYADEAVTAFNAYTK